MISQETVSKSLNALDCDHQLSADDKPRERRERERERERESVYVCERERERIFIFWPKVQNIGTAMHMRMAFKLKRLLSIMKVYGENSSKYTGLATDKAY